MATPPHATPNARRRLAFVLLAGGLGLAVGAARGAEESAPRGLTGCFAVTEAPAGRAGSGLRVLDQENADVLFTPASVTKLVTAAAALELLGAGHRVATEVRADGAVRDRTLVGDLVLVGAGDPTWSDRFQEDGAEAPLRRLARRVATRIGRVEGDLVLDVSRYPGRDVPPSRAVSEIAYAYGAPTGSLALQGNVAWLRIAPGPRVGAPARASWDEDEAPSEFDNRTVTAPASRHERGTFDVLPPWRGDVLVLRGEYPISEPPYRLPVALHDGELRVGKAFRRALEGAGVEVMGRIVLRETPRTADAAQASVTVAQVASVTVAQVASPPLAEWLPEILEDSDNWLAEMLLRHLAWAELGEGRTDDGAEHVAKVLTERAALADGALVLEDGSGLSPYGLVTPRAVVELLLWARGRPWWPVLASSLPGPGDGTLGAWPGLPAATRAKTGTLRHTVALAGVVGEGADAVVFACFVNHATEERTVLRRRLARRIAGW